MREMGLFEAKTKFSELCETISSEGESVLITRRGKPLVQISPCEPKEEGLSIWEQRAALEREQGKLTEDFALPRPEKQRWRDPLASARRKRK